MLESVDNLCSFVEIVLVLCMMSDFWLEPGQLGYCVWDSVSSLNLFLWLHLVGESGDHHLNTSFLRYKSRFHTEPLLGFIVVGVPPYCCAGESSGFWLGGAGKPLALLMQWSRVGGVHWVLPAGGEHRQSSLHGFSGTPAWGGWSFTDFLEWFAWSGTIIV